MNITILLPATTAAAISDQFGLAADDSALTLSSIGYGAGESTTLEILDVSTGSNVWAPVKLRSETYVLDANNNGFDIWDSWGVYRLNKTATVAPVGVSIRRL